MKTKTQLSQLLLVVLALAVSTQLSRANNIIWTNTAGGNWSDTNNWSTHQTPGSGDVAVITNDASYTVTLDTTPTVSGLVLGTAAGVNTQTFLFNANTFTLNGTAAIGASGSLTLSNNDVLAGNAILTGTLTCAGGAVSGALTVATNSVLIAVTPGLNLNNFSVGNSVVLTNYGTVSWVSADIYSDYSPQIYNYGLWNAQSDNTFQGQESHGFGNAIFNNYGIFRKSAGTGTTTVDANATFNTTGTLDVESGTVDVENGSGSGSLIAAASTVAYFDTRFSFAGATVFSGSGTVEGYLIGSNAVFSGTLNCLGDTLSGTLTVATNGVVNLGAADVVFDNFFAGVGILTNNGTVNWGAGNVRCENSPVVDNYGLWDDQADNTFYGQNPYGNGTFNNFGIFRKSGGSSVTTVDANTIFNTSGTNDVESAALQVENGTGSGALNVAGGSSASFGTRYTFAGGTVFSGAGLVEGYLIGNNAVFSGTLNCSGDTLSGIITVASNSVVNLGALNVAFDTLFAGSGILTNYGTVNLGAGNLDCNNSPVIDNYGFWVAQTDNTILGDNPYGTTTYNNFGTFRKAAGSGTSTVDANTIFDTSGTIDVESGTVSISGGGGGGAINVSGNTLLLGSAFILAGSTTYTGSGTVSGYLIGTNAVINGTLNCAGDTLSGTLTVSSNSVLNLGAQTVSFNSIYAGTGVLANYGTINWGAGNINCDNSPVIDNYGQWNILTNNSLSGRQSTGNTVINNYGVLRKSAGSGTSAFANNTLFTNTGTVDIQIGTFGLVGSFSLAGGTLNFGLNNSNSFGNINVSGSAGLGGAISANLNNSYVPGTNASFPLIACSSRTGTFASFNYPDLPAGLGWTNIYGNSAFTLALTTSTTLKLSGAATVQNGSTFTFSFGTVPGWNYQIQYTTNLAPVYWVNLGGPITASNSTITVSNAIQNPQLFYRAVRQ